MRSFEISHLLANTDSLRKRGEWGDALTGYEKVLKFLPYDPKIIHNIALCHLALGNYLAAQEQSLRAIQLKPSQWQSVLLHTKTLVANGQKDRALELLEELILLQPERAEIVFELAKLVMQHGGDAHRACQLVRPFLNTVHSRDAELVLIAAQLYDRDPEVGAQYLSERICSFAQKYLHLPKDTAERIEKSVFLESRSKIDSKINSNKKLKVGLLSPQFSVSPVYFFTFGSLQLISNEVDFIFFSRSRKTDWATRLFQSIAVDWIDVSLCSAEQLAVVLASNDLDVLIDLGGWMDPVGLQALSIKPAKKMFKWVGGQSATTGLTCFDGYITDRYQSPMGCERFHSEPLIRLQSGYVTYTPPPYLPKPLTAIDSNFKLGIIANPVKLSRSFLTELVEIHTSLKQLTDYGSVELHFIDKRYEQKNIRNRIINFLPGVNHKFITPLNHLDYLTAVSNLSATIDTWPYSGGLTTIEALAVGVPTFTRAGELFCERHSYSHFHYAGLKLSNFSVDNLQNFKFFNSSKHSLLLNNCPRNDHDALARELIFNLHLN